MLFEYHHSLLVTLLFSCPFIRWDKIDKGKYENNVKSYLENLTTEIDSFVDITKTLDNLNNILVKSTDDAAPKTKKGQEKTKVSRTHYQ
jgi:hypothetical protein